MGDNMKIYNRILREVSDGGQEKLNEILKEPITRGEYWNDLSEESERITRAFKMALTAFVGVAINTILIIVLICIIYFSK